MSSEFIRYLRCPITKAPLVLMEAAEIDALNKLIAQGSVSYRDGSPIDRKMDKGLRAIDHPFRYFIEDGIFILLETMAVIPAQAAASPPMDGLHKEKQRVKSFYDRVGWQVDKESNFEDAVLFEDLRSVSKDYIHKCHLRLNRYLRQHKGRYLLDAASGPIQYPEYLSYSEGFKFRVCVDISYSALKQAKQKLGDSGIYILADLTNLPILEDSVDGAISLHTVYHVPEEEQAQAFCELHRVIKPGTNAAIVYSWGGQAWAMRLALWPFRVGLKVARGARSLLPNGPKTPAVLYFHPKSYDWFKNRSWPFSYKIFVWRSLNLPFLRVYIHRALGGRQVLKFVYWLEERLPRLAGRLGEYPVFVIEK